MLYLDLSLFYSTGIVLVRTATYFFFILTVCLASLALTGGLALGLPASAGNIDISDTMHSFNRHKSISISQLMVNQKISETYSDILMEQQLLDLIYYYCLTCSLLILVLYSKNLPVIFLFLFILIRAALFSSHHHLLHLYNIFKNCYRKIVTIF